MTNKLCDKVLCKIKEEKIEPKPRWQFLLKNYSIWTAFGISVGIGAVAFCVVLDVLMDNDWDVYQYAIENPMEKIFLSLPFLWILALALFLGIAYYNCKNTKCGYKYETYYIVGLSILGSIILGSIFHYNFGMGEKMEALVAENLPFYRKIYTRCNSRDVWLQPDKGLLGGEIVKISVPTSFDLEDFNGVSWIVKEEKNMLVRGNEPLFEKEEVRIIGEREDDHIFRAVEIRPWKKKCPVPKEKE